ncbi:MAG: DUF4159 domain-containing protein [Vicinamibacterales bacterium]
MAVLRRRSATLAATAAITLLCATAGFAQRIWYGGYGYTPPRFPTNQSFQGSFNFCRAMFESNRREKRGWSTDYPGADLNFSTRLAELTKAPVTMRHDAEEGEAPDAVVVRLTDEALFKCPYILMEDAGTASFSGDEAQRLGEYLRKGGFLFVSDYWGAYAREQFDEQIRVALPESEYRIVDLPLNHPLWHTLFEMKTIPQMPSIQSWRRTGGNTDRGVVDPPSARGIVDEQNRVMVVMLHNTDIPDGWEREGEDPEYFFRFSPDAYAVGINIVLYAMTH